MTYFNVKSPAEIEAFEARYGDGCHGVKKHKPGTLKLLKDFDGRAAAEFDSRQAGNPKGPNDLWVDLYEHNKDKNPELLANSSANTFETFSRKSKPINAATASAPW